MGGDDARKVGQWPGCRAARGWRWALEHQDEAWPRLRRCGAGFAPQERNMKSG